MRHIGPPTLSVKAVFTVYCSGSVAGKPQASIVASTFGKTDGRTVHDALFAATGTNRPGSAGRSAGVVLRRTGGRHRDVIGAAGSRSRRSPGRAPPPVGRTPPGSRPGRSPARS